MNGRQAGIFALLAVLLFASAPALEATHDHDAGASYADCLLCKQATDLTVATEQAPLSVRQTATTTIAIAVLPAVSRFPANYSPRGPPQLS